MCVCVFFVCVSVFKITRSSLVMKCTVPYSTTLKIIEDEVQFGSNVTLKVSRHAPAPALVSKIAYHCLVPVLPEVVSWETGMVAADMLSEKGACLPILLFRHVRALRRRTRQFPEMTR